MHLHAYVYIPLSIQDRPHCASKGPVAVACHSHALCNFSLAQ